MNLEKELMGAINDSEFDIDCPNCGKIFDVKISQVGTKVNCPQCDFEIELKG